jgi:GntR family transcriptional regulator
MSRGIDFGAGINIRWGRAAGAQIEQYFQEKILSGKFGPGDRLPTVREAAIEFGVNFNTVARAYRRLESAGWVVVQQGSGTYVCKSIPGRTESDYKEKKLLDLAYNYFIEARRLGASLSEAVQIVNQLASVGKSKPSIE